MNSNAFNSFVDFAHPVPSTAVDTIKQQDLTRHLDAKAFSHISDPATAALAFQVQLSPVHALAAGRCLYAVSSKVSHLKGLLRWLRFVPMLQRRLRIHLFASEALYWLLCGDV